MIRIRPETENDIAAIRHINEMAFGGREEADIVDKVRRQPGERLSLVAVDEDGELLGHILFSPASLASKDGQLEGMALAPMAVLPDHQNRGIGTQLANTGIEMLRAKGCPFIIVLGHAHYYPRFGFQRASKYNIHSQWDGVPDEAFMILVLQTDGLPPEGGAARYSTAFDDTAEEDLA
jgi:putative acetyltransferase